jgi:putative aminopeptidase FrvX
MRRYLPIALLLFAISASAQDRTQLLLEKLSNAAGPPGAEEPVRAIMVPEMKQFATAPITYDGLGSAIGQQGSSGPRIMIDAHMDELGGMVRRVTPTGFLSMQMLGGWLDQALVDQRWIIIGSKGPVHAVTGIRDVHIITPPERTQVFSRDQLFLDVGAKNAAEVAAMGVSPGDPVVPDSPFLVMNGSKNYLGKAWDDRIGCAVLLEAMRRTAAMPHANTLLYVATTQEEVGLRGGRTASQTVKPDIGIAIEGGITGDAGGARPEESQVKLGAGPGMFLYDSSAIPNRKVVAFVRKTAAAANIPLQADLVQGYGDESA